MLPITSCMPCLVFLSFSQMRIEGEAQFHQHLPFCHCLLVVCCHGLACFSFPVAMEKKAETPQQMLGRVLGSTRNNTGRKQSPALSPSRSSRSPESPLLEYTRQTQGSTGTKNSRSDSRLDAGSKECTRRRSFSFRPLLRAESQL